MDNDQEGAATASGQLVAYLAAALASRVGSDGDDVLSRILRIDVNGTPITMEDAVSLTYLVLAAGHETTVGGLSSMLYHVGRDRQIRDRLLADRSLIPIAIEEVLRLETPIPGIGRTVVQDTALGDTQLCPGDRVLVLFGAANRDPEAFEDPNSFRLDRKRNPHLTFGAGIHRCVGAPLARLEMRIVLEEVLERMPELRLVSEDGVRVHVHTNRSYTAVPLSW